MIIPPVPEKSKGQTGIFLRIPTGYGGTGRDRILHSEVPRSRGAFGEFPCPEFCIARFRARRFCVSESLVRSSSPGEMSRSIAFFGGRVRGNFMLECCVPPGVPHLRDFAPRKCVPRIVPRTQSSAGDPPHKKSPASAGEKTLRRQSLRVTVQPGSNSGLQA